jgi:hypothetical protein
MKLPSQTELLELARFSGEPCLSLYLPTHRCGAEAKENPAQLRRLLRLADACLGEHAVAPSAREDLLKPLRRWLEDVENWRRPGAGLAFFAAPGFFRAFALDLTPAEGVSVDRRFRLRPLLGLLERQERFYLLALSAHHVRVLEATLHGGHLAVHRLAPPHLPANMAEALGPMVFYSDTQMHSASNPKLGGRPGLVHGQGDGDQEHYKSDLLAYFWVVARVLREALVDREAPLVLAAVAEYLPIYRAASHDPRLVDRVVGGNPDLESDAELAARAVKIVGPQLARQRRTDLRRLADLAGSRRVERQLPEIARAADQGRVEALFLTAEAEHWGVVNPATGEARLHARKRSGDEDLVERAALAAAVRGGAVHVMAGAEMPGPGDVVAVLRY